MSFLRTLPARHHLTPALRTQRAAFTTARRSLASQDYGSGAGDPKGEKPQEQGPNPSADKEHPGPPPPSVGKGKGSKGNNETSSKGQQQKGTQQQSGGAQPKILNADPPKEGEQSAEVERHNRDMENRAEKAHEKVSNEEAEKDKVGKGFWSGTY